MEPLIKLERKAFHKALLESVLVVDKDGIPSNADKFQSSSVLFAKSDRAQNSRLEALNLIRNRKGRLPHVILVTGEPTPSRLSSIALGTGDIDCVYHFALNELKDTVVESGNDEALQMLKIMIDGKRLKDISDLPLDLTV